MSSLKTYKELKEAYEKKVQDLKADYDKKIEDLKVEYEKKTKEAGVEFEEKVKELQKNCKHPQVSVIIKTGHDKKEKICDICNAVIKKAKITIHMP
ncbi:MAG: hypothetical protein ACTSO9_04805 [Candidatus Helarchaeota archaeon]